MGATLNRATSRPFIRALDGGARPLLGDAASAIWVPKADPVIQVRTLLLGSRYSARAEMRLEVFADRLRHGQIKELDDIVRATC